MTARPTVTGGDDLAPVRTRLRRVLFVVVALMTTGYLASATVAGLAARDIMGSDAWVGVPSAVGVLSTAVGTAVLGRVVVSAGRRRSMVVGTVAATAGSLVAALGVFAGSMSALAAGMSIMGLGYATSHLSRYAAADLVAPQRRGSAVSLVVWAGTVGAVVGPSIVGPAGTVASGMGRVAYGGGFMVAGLAMGSALVVVALTLRPDPSTVAVVDGASSPASGDAAALIRTAAAIDPLPAAGGARVGEASGGQQAASALGAARRAMGSPAVQVAVVTMVTGQFVMVLVMTATPIHIEDQGMGLEMVGGVISAHTLGMFAFAPVVGWAVDRVGPRRVIAASAVVLALSGALAAMAPAGALGALTTALFLLGIGWNLSFVAGSTLLSVSVAPDVRPLVQGRVDAMVWTASAAGNIASGLVLATLGFATSAWASAAMMVVVVAALWRARGGAPGHAAA